VQSHLFALFQKVTKKAIKRLHMFNPKKHGIIVLHIQHGLLCSYGIFLTHRIRDKSSQLIAFRAILLQHGIPLWGNPALSVTPGPA